MKRRTKADVAARLRRVEGQVRGLQRMVDEEQYCIDIINQSSAVRNALSALEDVMLENHLEEHAAEQLRGAGKRRAIAEVISVFKKAKKK